jgi:hypothetical protein
MTERMITITFRVPASMRQQILEIAGTTRGAMSDFVREALQREIERQHEIRPDLNLTEDGWPRMDTPNMMPIE